MFWKKKKIEKRESVDCDVKMADILLKPKGDTITPQESLENTGVLGCVRVLSESMAKMPLKVYRVTDNGNVIDRSTPEARLFKSGVNPFQSTYSWVETAMTHLAHVDGNSFSLIKRNSAGRVNRLDPLDPADITIHTRQDDPEPIYDHVRLGIIPFNKILHIKGLSADGFRGVTPMAFYSKAAKIGIHAQNFALSFFKNSGILGGLLKTDKRMPLETQVALLDSFAQMHTGDGVYSTKVLADGLEYEPITSDNTKSQMIETRKFQILEICRVFGVPPHMLADLERATFSNIEQQGIDFVTYTLSAWMIRFESEINRKFWPKGNYFVKFNADSMLRADAKSRMETHAVGRRIGALSINEIRGMEDMPGIGEDGDTYLQELNMTPVGKDKNNEEN